MQNGQVLGLRAPVQAFGIEKELDALAHTGCPPLRVLSLQKLEKQRLLPATLLKQAEQTGTQRAGGKEAV